jgi:putative transposase
MQLVERHIINKEHEFWSECDQICFLSKNIYNRHSALQNVAYK